MEPAASADRPVELLERLSAAIAIGCGLWLLIPFRPNDTLYSAQTYTAMREIARPFHPYEEVVWAALSLSGGAFQLWAIRRNCARWRQVANILAAAYWGGMTVMFLQSNPAALLPVPFACFTCALMYVYHKVRS